MLLLASPSDVNQLTLFVVLYNVNPMANSNKQLLSSFKGTNKCFDNKKFKRMTAGIDLAL